MLPPRSPGIITNPVFVLFAAAAALSVLKAPISPPKNSLSLLHHHHRRRRRLGLKPPPTMDHTPTTAIPSSPLAFSSPDSLSDWLSPRLPPGSLASWGSLPGTKTLHNLYLELSQGETTILPQSPTPIRAVRVVTVRVRNPRGALLVESRQLLSDGSVRPRNRPLSEKMRPGEAVQDAALRAVREELGDAAADAARIVPGSCQTRVEERGSASYPGLPARYVLYSVDAEVGGLPEDGEFSTEEAGEGLEALDEKAIFVRRHFWKWIDDDDQDDGSAVQLPA